jgi:uncharacterized membrane protein
MASLRWEATAVNDFVFARVLHVIGVVLWIGGVGMVTTVLLPAIRRAYPPSERFEAFHQLESRFARQARVTTVITGASGLFLVWRMDLWDRFQIPAFWWMHAMALTWSIFTAMLFLIEPLFLERLLERRAKSAPEATYRFVERLHWALLTLSLVTVAGAVAGSVGGSLFAW